MRMIIKKGKRLGKRFRIQNIILRIAPVSSEQKIKNWGREFYKRQ